MAHIFEDKGFQAKLDLEDITKAEEIKNSPKRLAAVKRKATEQMEAVSDSQNTKHRNKSTSKNSHNSPAIAKMLR